MNHISKYLKKYEAGDITTAEEAEAFAIEWQRWASEQSLSYGEIAEWANILRELAEKFHLEEVFKENGII